MSDIKHLDDLPFIGKYEPTEGTKNDSEKIRMDLIPYDALWEVGKVLTFGVNVKEYGERNWEKGITYSRVFGAMMRHATRWFFRFDNDEESRLSHMAHAVTCGMFLLVYQLRKMKQFDNRPSAQYGTFTEEYWSDL